MKSLFGELKTDLATALEKAKSEAKTTVDAKTGLLTAMPEYAKAGTAVQDHVTRAVAEAKASIDREALISAVQGDANHFEATTYIALMQEIYAAANPPAPEPGPDRPPRPAAPTVVAYSSVVRDYAKPVIASRADVDAYLAFVKEKLETALAEGKKIAFD